MTFSSFPFTSKDNEDSQTSCVLTSTSKDFLLVGLSIQPELELLMPPNALPENRLGLHEITGPSNVDRKLNVVFLHGLGGDSWTTWMNDPNKLETLWPSWLGEDFPDFRIWTLGYAAEPSRWKGESMPLADQGNKVLEQLSAEGLGGHPLVLITHSMGGIVAKQILRHAESFGVSRWEAISQCVKGIAFIATPHSGANIAGFAEFVKAVYRTNEQVGELKAHHPRLRELHGWFLNYLQKRDKQGQKIVCRTYCEKFEVPAKIPLLNITLPKGILVVDETSAEPNITGERAIPLEENHLSICKPQSRSADLYKSLRVFFQECVGSLPHPQ